ncbi:LOW QUALITY PROTEIN: hypothetical protein ACHAWF_013444 [Thalassiosira exigua]
MFAVKCGDCGTTRAVYSDHAVRIKRGRMKSELEGLVKSLEDGYVCGASIKKNWHFFVSRDR